MRTVQLRRYQVAVGHMRDWLQEWDGKVRPLREAHGFKVLGAWAVEDTDEIA